MKKLNQLLQGCTHFRNGPSPKTVQQKHCQQSDHQAASPPKKSGRIETLAEITKWNECPEICKVKCTQKAFPVPFAGTKCLPSGGQKNHLLHLWPCPSTTKQVLCLQCSFSNIQRKSRYFNRTDTNPLYNCSITICIYLRGNRGRNGSALPSLLQTQKYTDFSQHLGLLYHGHHSNLLVQVLTLDRRKGDCCFFPVC